MMKPVLLLIDGDAKDLAALADALTSRYGANHDIRTAATATEAITIIDEAGASLDLLIVSRDLESGDPQDLFDRAAELQPGVKRVLSARYVDRSAFELITAAMRSRAIDYFLYKPWEPTEIRLFPVIDDLLMLSRANRGETGFEVVRIVGKPGDVKSHKLRDGLARASVPYGYYDSESDEGGRILAEAGVDGTKLPVVVTHDGAVIVDPEFPQVGEALGVKTSPDPGLYDLAIVGAGPGGLAASVYAASEGLRTILLEREVPGGQAGTSSRIENYLGFPRGVSGGELAWRAFEQAWRFGVSVVFAAATGLRPVGECRVVDLSNTAHVESRAVIIATGMSYRRLEVPTLDRFFGAGVYYGAAVSEAQACGAKEVIVVGAGNSAGQAAVHLARFASKVTIVVRGTSLSTSMSDYLIRQIEALSNVEVLFGTRVVEGSGNKRLEAVTLESADGTCDKRPATNLFVLIGGTPHADWLSGSVECNKDGFILTGRDLLASGCLPKCWPIEREPFHLETSIPGVFAVGDVRCRSVKRVASAVGEGAAAIQLVHEFLRLD